MQNNSCMIHTNIYRITSLSYLGKLLIIILV
jgi:hypothetical protein